MFGLSAPLLAGGTMALLGAGGLTVGYLKHQNGRQEATQLLDEKLDSGDEVRFEPPEMTSTPLDYFRAMRHLQAKRRAAKKGYIKWYRLGSTMQRPRWVKPEQSGAGPLKTKADGVPYYFDKDAMIVDEETGAYVAVHREGESDPINLADPAYPGIEADRMERIANLEAEDKPPGLLDGLGDMDTQTMVYLAIGLLFIVFAAYRYMG